MSDTYVTADGLKIRVIGNNLLVRPDPLPERSAGGIFYAPDAMEHVNNTGTVVAVGTVTAKTEERIPIPGLKVGDRVVFIRFLALQETNQQLAGIVGEDLIRLRPADIQLVFDAEDLQAVRFEFKALQQESI